MYFIYFTLSFSIVYIVVILNGNRMIFFKYTAHVSFDVYEKDMHSSFSLTIARTNPKEKTLYNTYENRSHN